MDTDGVLAEEEGVGDVAVGVPRRHSRRTSTSRGGETGGVGGRTVLEAASRPARASARARAGFAPSGVQMARTSSSSVVALAMSPVAARSSAMRRSVSARS